MTEKVHKKCRPIILATLTPLPKTRTERERRDFIIREFIGEDCSLGL